MFKKMNLLKNKINLQFGRINNVDFYSLGWLYTVYFVFVVAVVEVEKLRILKQVHMLKVQVKLEKSNKNAKNNNTEAQNQSMQKVHGWIVNEFRTTMRLII